MIDDWPSGPAFFGRNTLMALLIKIVFDLIRNICNDLLYPPSDGFYRSERVCKLKQAIRQVRVIQPCIVTGMNDMSNLLNRLFI